MNPIRSRAATCLILVAAFVASPVAAQQDLEEIVGQHMVAEALLAAHLVAVAEKAGLTVDEVDAILKDVVDRSPIDEIWITDAEGTAVFRTAEAEFTFSPDPDEQPQASAFWPLLTGEEQVVVQKAQTREIDDKIFKYVAVAGVDQPRIVQVGIAADHIAEPGN